MSGKVVILGHGVDQRASRVYADRWDCSVWTLNDWWRVYPLLINPNRVYQIHDNYEGAHKTNQARKWEDWKRRYNKSQAEIVVINCYDGLDNQRVFEVERARRDFGNSFFGCSVSYMVADAIWENYAEIELIGFPLNSKEYDYQVSYMIMAINEARRRGINVICADEINWEKVTVDWENIIETEYRYGQNEFKPLRVLKNE